MKHEKIKDLPLLFAFGKGNGKMTVNNTKNSGPKGPSPSGEGCVKRFRALRSN